MKICRITSAFVPPWSGLGPGPYELSIGQAKLGHDVTVITKYSKGCEAIDSKAGITIYRIKVKRNLFFGLLAAVKFLSLNIRNKFDLVHGHGDSILALLLLRKLLRFKMPIVCSVHIVRKSQDKVVKKVSENWASNKYFDIQSLSELQTVPCSKRDMFYERLYLKYSDMLTVVNTNLADEIKDEYRISNKIKIIFNGVNTACFQDKSKSKSLTGRKKYLLLFVGVLNGRKGEFDLLRALKVINESNFDVRLIVVGDGPTKESAIEMTRILGIENMVDFLGNIAPAKLGDYYHQCDLFVLPSYSEGLPKVILEAMASGIAVVASDIKAHQTVIKHKDTGYLFKTGDIESFSSVIIEALSDTDTKTISRNARENVINHFTWECVCKCLDKIYFELLNTK